MLAVVVLTDQLVWRTVIAWAEKFKFENVEAADAPHSPVLNLIRRSGTLAFLSRRAFMPLRERMALHFAKLKRAELTKTSASPAQKLVLATLGLAAVVGVGYALYRSAVMVSGIGAAEFKTILIGGLATFGRVMVTLVIGSLWTISSGGAISPHPNTRRFAPPLPTTA